MNDAPMNEGISEIQRFLEIARHLEAGTTTDTRKVVAKLRIAALAPTLALTTQAARR